MMELADGDTPAALGTESDTLRIRIPVSRTALARAYRPRTFGEVATQEHVSATLRSAVQRDRVAHAYLFCGPRGVGKTTVARVLAMSLNCPNRVEAGEPCGSCESCQRIWAGKTSLDVVEIDAASNRGVDDARDLRERAMYAPSEEGRFKVYIIDEAHMLTREAWNALLKILEEPPPRVIFVFATTEPQKIQQAAPPILSRCQRFDFHRISTADLVRRMRSVLSSEGVDASDDVLLPIAQKADGGMRDALSLLDQVLSFTEGRPTPADVARVLGLVEDELFLELADTLAERRSADVFRFVARLLEDGYDLAEFYRGLADFLRTLLIIRMSGPDAAEVRPDLRDAFAARAGRFESGDLLRMLSQVAELDADGRFRKSGQQRILIELLLLKFCYLESTVAIEDVIALLGGGGGAAARLPATPPVPRPPSRSVVREGVPPAPPAPPGPALPSSSDRPPLEDSSPGASPGASRADAERADAPADSARGEFQEQSGSATGPPAGSTVLDPVRVRRAWKAVMEAGTGVPPGLRVLLRTAPVSPGAAGVVRLGLPAESPVRERLSAPGVQRPLEDALAKQLGAPVTLVLDEIAAGEGTGTATRITAESARHERLRRLIEEEPLLGEAVQEWDLELTE
jgi:DNA polymerase III subunit gamma/tau